MLVPAYVALLLCGVDLLQILHIDVEDVVDQGICRKGQAFLTVQTYFKFLTPKNTLLKLNYRIFFIYIFLVFNNFKFVSFAD